MAETQKQYILVMAISMFLLSLYHLVIELFHRSLFVNYFGFGYRMSVVLMILAWMLLALSYAVGEWK